MKKYIEMVTEDVKRFIKKHVNEIDWTAVRYDVEDQIYELAYISDAVTGNESAGYYKDEADAREMVLANMDEVRAELLADYNVGYDMISDWFLNEQWNVIDCVTRCGMLPDAISAALDALDEVERRLP